MLYWKVDLNVWTEGPSFILRTYFYLTKQNTRIHLMQNNVLSSSLFSSIDQLVHFIHCLFIMKKIHIPRSFFFLSVTNWIFYYHIIIIPMIDPVISQLIINQNMTMFPNMMALVSFSFQFCDMWTFYFLCKPRFLK